MRRPRTLILEVLASIGAIASGLSGAAAQGVRRTAAKSTAPATEGRGEKGAGSAAPAGRTTCHSERRAAGRRYRHPGIPRRRRVSEGCRRRKREFDHYIGRREVVCEPAGSGDAQYRCR